MRALAIGVALLALTLPLAPGAVNIDSLSGFALLMAWGAGCGVVALGMEHLLRIFSERRNRST